MKHQLLKWAILQMVIALSLFNAQAQVKPGQVDRSYAPNFDGNILSMSLGADGRHVYVGGFKHVGTRAIRGLIRLNVDGTPDATFNPGGSGFNESATAVAQTEDGKWLVAGYFTEYNGQPVGSLVRINTDGTLDKTFKSDNLFALEGSPDEVQLQHIAPLPDGRFYVAGGFNRVNGKLAPLIARFNADGSHDETFLPTTEEIHLKTSPYVDAFYMDPDGAIYIGGAFGAYGGSFDNKRMVRIAPDGKLDLEFHRPDFDGYVKSIKPFGKDSLLVAGDFLEAGGKPCFLSCIMDKMGTLSTNYKPMIFGYTDTPEDESLTIFSAEPVRDGVIIAGGDVFAPAHSFLKLLDKNGACESDAYTFGEAPNSLVTYMLADETNGWLYVSGFFRRIGSVNAPYFVRIAIPKSSDTAVKVVATPSTEIRSTYYCGRLTLQGIEPIVGVTLRNSSGQIVYTNSQVTQGTYILNLPLGLYLIEAVGNSGTLYHTKLLVTN